MITRTNAREQPIPGPQESGALPPAEVKAAKNLLTEWEASTERAEWRGRNEVREISTEALSGEASPEETVASDPRWAPVVRVTDELVRLHRRGTVHDDVLATRAELAENLRKLQALEAIGAGDEEESRLSTRRGALVQRVEARFGALLESLEKLHLELVDHTVGATDPVATKLHDLVARAVAVREVERAADDDESLRRARKVASERQGS